MDLRARILKAASDLYGETGFRGTTTRQIAQRAGVNEVTLFRQFGTKTALLHEAIKCACGQPQRPSLPERPGDRRTGGVRQRPRRGSRSRPARPAKLESDGDPMSGFPIPRTRGAMIKDAPDHYDAELLLRLYDLRREPLLHESRRFLTAEFWP